ncbi:ATP-binding cassette domain-containing protein, partial [Sporichthya brevicatena]|uniref:ATP-binding cassette domain-containing protein n=1 Tax=Sporichthya brevicatena TaxID=171442 RepID=UPI0031D37F01
MIEFDAVTKVYPGGTVAVENLSLIAPTGRITVVVGPSGCGKTTLLRMVNRLVDPSAGRVLIDGAANTLLRRSALRRSIGYVIAKGGLFPHRTVVENIETVPLLMGTKPRQARELAHALLERVGLSLSFADKFPGQLSTGQQLRVALARALAADPPVLLMDEPFSTLDPVVRGDLQDDLLDLQQAAPKTILFVTHDIDEAIKLGDQIAVMDTGGRLVQIATPETLLVHPGTDFVADFLGRDRGIRKLAFLPVSDLPLAPAATVQAGATGDRAKAISAQHNQDWLLVLDPERHPRGWVDTSKLGPTDVVSGQVVYPLGGTFYPDESVLAALDAAILSPPGLAVCVDDDGLVQGVVSHGDIARYLAARGPSTLPSRLGGPAVSAATPAPAPAPAAKAAPPAKPAPEPQPAPEPKPAPEPTPPPAPKAAPQPKPAPAAAPPAAPAAPAAKPIPQPAPSAAPPQPQQPKQPAPPETPTVEVMRTPPASVHPVAPPPGDPAASAPKPAPQPAPQQPPAAKP